MIENQSAGVSVFSCPYFKTEPVEGFTTVTRESDKLICKGNGKTCLCDPDHNPCGKTIAAIIDSDRKDEALRIAALLKQRTRPIIIAPPEPSPHPYLDDAIANINHEQEIIRKAVRHV
jgi:hypothetical protein